MADIPNLAGVATAELVETIGGGNFKASYINWSRTLNLLRVHAPGWLPEVIKTSAGDILHRAPVGGYLEIRFLHPDGTATPPVPQAVMDSRNAAIAFDKITARDITDTHRRGVCLAAALTFGLAYELWAKVALESGYGDQAPEQPEAPQRITPTGGVWESLDEETQQRLEGVLMNLREYMEQGDASGANDYLGRAGLSSEEKIAVWSKLDSKTRSALKKASEEK